MKMEIWKKFHGKKGLKLLQKKWLQFKKSTEKESVAFISTGQIPTEDMALLGHVGRNYMKINGDGNTRLCMATSVVAISKALVLMCLHTH